MKNVPSEIYFGRTYSFYLKPNKDVGALSFQVTVKAQKKIDPKTGMSVDLVSLDQLSKKILRPQINKNSTITRLIAKLASQFKAGLRMKGAKLVSIQFDEIRGSGFLFKGSQIYFIRIDYAADRNGDLYKVQSYFDKKNQLIRTDLTNFKLNFHEQFIFSNGSA